ncbi:MAG: hypothetical protein U0174_19955 [Polyangiaceae bacterium]
MKGRTFSFLLQVSPFVVATLLACSATVNGNSGDAGAAGCDSSKCAKDNQCIADAKGEVKCRLTCSEHLGAKGCGSSQYCNLSAKTPYCADIDGKKVTPKPGQWGGRCTPTDGEDNAACDGSQGFKCFAESPTDVNSALCTTFGCKADSECPGQFYCATVNTAPSAVAADRTYGETRTVCLPRTQCSPCVADADCKSGRCVADGNGVKSCMATCDRDSSCPKDAACIGGVADVNVCYPYATVCKGDGSLCSPCRSDKDCTNGVCYDALPNSTERYCTQKVENCTAAACPKPASGAKVACFKDTTPGVGGHCTGLAPLLTGSNPDVPACWSKRR